MQDYGNSRREKCLGTSGGRCVLRAARAWLKLFDAFCASGGETSDPAEPPAQATAPALAEYDPQCRLARGLPCEFAPRKPIYDEDAREVRLGGVIVLRFARKAWNQMAILKRFESDGWPSRVVNPLGNGMSAKHTQRLKNAASRLCQRRECPLIRFGCDIGDQAVYWELTENR